MYFRKDNCCSLLNKGFKFDPRSSRLYDMDGSRCFAISLKNGKFVVFKNDPSTLEKIKQLSKDATSKYNEREKNRRYINNDTYTWSTNDRGGAFHDWKTTQPLWDDEDFRKQKGVNVPANWRDEDTWLKRRMNNAINSYGRKK